MTETGTLTIADFLLARIAEDEMEARTAAEFPYSIRSTPWGETFDLVADGPDDRADHWLCVDPARVLAECAAKRGIVEHFGPNYGGAEGFEVAATYALEYLATIYADHPDFREEWRA